jgi:hypothetical protein
MHGTAVTNLALNLQEVSSKSLVLRKVRELRMLSAVSVVMDLVILLALEFAPKVVEYVA